MIFSFCQRRPPHKKPLRTISSHLAHYCSPVCLAMLDKAPRLSIYLVMTFSVFVLTIQIERQQCCLALPNLNAGLVPTKIV